MKTKLFFDCEFTGLHQNTTLVSLALVSSCGKTFYAEFCDYDRKQIDDWIQANVIENLFLKQEFKRSHQAGNVTVYGDKTSIARHLKEWIALNFAEVEIWSDCLSYDWVLFCDLFGGAMHIPKSVYYIPFDISTMMKINGVDPDINREEFCNHQIEVNDAHNWGAKKHNALWDAYVIRECYKRLTTAPCKDNQ